MTIKNFNPTRSLLSFSPGLMLIPFLLLAAFSPEIPPYQGGKVPQALGGVPVAGRPGAFPKGHSPRVLSENGGSLLKASTPFEGGLFFILP